MWKTGISDMGMRRLAQEFLENEEEGMEAQDYQTWVVVSFYAGDAVHLGIEGYKKPRGFVRLVGAESDCKKEAEYMQDQAGGGKSHVIFEAYPIVEASSLFDIGI